MEYNLKLKVGNDNGNSEHDIVINGDIIEQPNVISRVRKAPNVEELNNELFISNIENNLIVDIISDEVKTGTYLCGNYALKSGQTVRTINIGYDNDKSKSEIIMVNTLAQIAGYSVKQAFKDSNLDGKLNVLVDMTTSLPVSQYNKSKANEFAERFTTSTHLVNVKTPQKNIQVEIKFDFVKVIPEGVTAIFALKNASDELFKNYNETNEEKLNKTFFTDKKVLHVAIGEGTTELPITNDIAFDPNFIEGINNGIGLAINKSLPEFQDECGQTDLSRQKYSEILKDKHHKNNDLALDIIDFYIDEQADKILDKAKTEIDRSNNEVDLVAVYGGGSILMRENLEKPLKEVCNRAKTKLLYVDAQYAVTLEAWGLYNFTCSNIFDQIKEMSKSK